jgi:ATP-dependent Clp protease ATP-binding subunit ClpA|tara:strand:+ start:378 stop:878 length:501 start_codon:yes stop_codon:yes gene_type:complete
MSIQRFLEFDPEPMSQSQYAELFHNNFSEKAKEAMRLSNQAAQKYDQEIILPEHLLRGIIESGGHGTTILFNIGLNRTKTLEEIDDKTERGPRMIQLGKLPLTEDVYKIMGSALTYAKDLGDNFIGTEHITNGLFSIREGLVYDLFSEQELTREAYRLIHTKLRTE